VAEGSESDLIRACIVTHKLRWFGLLEGELAAHGLGCHVSTKCYFGEFFHSSKKSEESQLASAYESIILEL